MLRKDIRIYVYVTHWLLECNAWCTECQPLLQAMRHITNDFDNLCEDDKLVLHSSGQGMPVFVNTEEYYGDVDCSVLVMKQLPPFLLLQN